MNFYGVGVRFGGVDDMLPLFLEKNCWFMGFNKDEKENMSKTISEINAGDILIAKAYANIAQRTYPIRAIGIVVNKGLPHDIPEKYQNKLGVSVIWIKHFENKIHLIAKEYRRGPFHTKTVFHEKNDDMICKIKEMMKYDYIEESEEKETDNLYSKIPDSDYIEIANLFILDQACSFYEEYVEEKDLEIYTDDDNIEIVDQDSFGRKIIRVPFVVDVCKKGLILLVPEKDWRDNEIRLCNMGVELMNENTDELESIKKLKSKTDWNSKIDL